MVRVNGSDVAACSLSDIQLRGTHNQENTLAAACMAMAFGVSPESITKGVRSFRGVEHRMESVTTINGVEYINNSMCTNPEAFARSLEAVGGSTIVIAGGKHKGGSLVPVAEAVKTYAKKLILIGVSAGEIESAVRTIGYNEVSKADSLDSAVEMASKAAVSGDSVILAPACASFDMFSGFEERGNVFKNAVWRLAGRDIR
jgi:UDP-N-acetylmuramoylalanine--D-glutamate ligase